MTSSAADPLLGRLDAPAKAALRWAAAMARARSEPDDSWQVDSRDLLAGILLADLRGSPARELLEHYRIPVGAVLRRDRVRQPSAEELLEALEEIPEALMPPADSLASDVIGRVNTIRVDPPDTLISLRELFGVLLEGSTPTDPLSMELEDRGVNPAQLVRYYRDYLSGRATYREFLREWFPYRPRHAELPRYHADQPGLDGLRDLVGIKAEVDAFAYLIASRNLTPPLAVGLFGDWGSGKSYFLRSLQRRIDQVARDSDAGDATRLFHGHIVQIEFNAWQYVGGDLWAGLLEHLFRNLRRTGDADDNLLTQRQQFWVRRVQGATIELATAEIKRQELEGKRDAARQEVEDRRQDRQRGLAEIERKRQEQPLAGWRPSEELRQQVAKAAAEAGIEAVGTSAEELARDLGRARDALRSAGSVLTPLRARGWRYWLAIGLVILLPVAAAVTLSVFKTAPLTAVTATVASVLAALAGYVRLATWAISATTQRIQKAQAELDAGYAEQRKALDDEVAQAEQRLATVQTELDAAVRTERELAVKADEASAELAAITPSRVLSDFIADRLASEDYRKHLGVPAIVRRDLDQLSTLMAAAQREEVPDEYAIDRIVLYIDDLDRCPTELVIKVLEAVHLLLAFPLFVVVVAVDSRWLTQSLKEHHKQLSGSDATPENYLEKIFQVPFWVLPVETTVRQQILRGLLLSSVAGRPPPTDADTRVSTSGLQASDIPEFRELVNSFAITDQDDQVWRAATGLTITADELLAIESVADLIGTTPRAAKRFANIYLLVRSIGVNRGLALPLGGQLAVLLAISTGLPAVAAALFSAAPNLGATDTMKTLAQTVSLPAGPETDKWVAWIETHAEYKDHDLSGLADWVDLISRFRFSSGTVA